jgi:cytidylate kinase
MLITISRQFGAGGSLVASPEVPLVTATPVESLDEAELVKVTEVVVAEVAREGRVVLVGRAASAVLVRETGAIHVQLVAPRAFRIRVVAERSSIDAKAAEKQIGETDAQRGRYHQQYYGRDWRDPVNYHMVLNTGALGFEGAANVIVARAKSMGW